MLATSVTSTSEPKDVAMMLHRTHPCPAAPPDVLALRAARIVSVLASFLASGTDAHSVEVLCRGATPGAAASTFRRWCQCERVIPRRALDLARLLRALNLARTQKTSVLEWLDIDPRTFQSLVQRAQVPELLDNMLPTNRDFLTRQRLVCNPTILRLLIAITHERAAPLAD